MLRGLPIAPKMLVAGVDDSVAVRAGSRRCRRRPPGPGRGPPVEDRRPQPALPVIPVAEAVAYELHLAEFLTPAITLWSEGPEPGNPDLAGPGRGGLPQLCPQVIEAALRAARHGVLSAQVSFRPSYSSS